MSKNSNFTNIKSIHIDYTLFVSISLSILSLKLSMTMGTLYYKDVKKLLKPKLKVRA